MLTRPERIRFLLEYYVDVVAGVRDRGTGGEHIPLMCACWNHPSYQELERLRGEMRTGAPALYKAVVAVYVYPRFVRRAVCPKCDVVAPPELVGELHRHRHGRKSAPFVARMVRVPLYPVVAGHVDAAIGWMDERWRGSVFVPDELLPLVEAAGQDERPRRMLHAPLMPAYDRTESELFASILINTLLVLDDAVLGCRNHRGYLRVGGREQHRPGDARLLGARRWDPRRRRSGLLLLAYRHGAWAASRHLAGGSPALYLVARGRERERLVVCFGHVLAIPRLVHA